jgi:hypothetical protein
MRSRSAMLAGLSTLVLSCSFDLTDVQPTSRGAYLQIELSDEGSSEDVEFETVFHPGITPDGRLQQLSTETLVIDGVEVPAASVQPDGARIYPLLELPSAEFPVTLRAPVLERATDSIPVIVLESLRILAADTVVIHADDLNVRIEGSAAMPGQAMGSWSVSAYVDGQGAPVSSLSVNSIPPESVQIPTSLLPQQAGARGRVIVSVKVRNRVDGGEMWQVDVYRTTQRTIHYRTSD